jgi:hypothetical protein
MTQGIKLFRKSNCENLKATKRFVLSVNTLLSLFKLNSVTLSSQDSSVGIPTAYGLQGQGLISGRGNRFLFYSIASRQAMGPKKPPIQWVSEAL